MYDYSDFMEKYGHKIVYIMTSYLQNAPYKVYKDEIDAVIEQVLDREFTLYQMIVNKEKSED